MIRTLKFLGLLALIVLAHLLWTHHAARRGGDGGAETKSTTSVSVDSSDSSSPAMVVRTPGAWPVYRGDAGMSGACEGQLGDSLEPAWRFETGKEVKSSAVIDGGRVFIGSSDGNVYAIALDSGRELWKFRASAPVVAPPVLLGDSVIVGDENGSGGVVYCLDAADGSPRWTTITRGKIVASANHFVDAAGRQCVLVGSWDHRLYALNAADGQTLWSIKMGNYINTPCSLSGRTGVLPVCDASVRVLDLAKTEVVWETPLSGLISATMAVREGRGYAADCNGADSLYCMDLSTGDVVWQRPLGAATMGPVSVTADRVLVATSGSVEAALHCFTLAGELVWRVPLIAGSNAGPLVIGDRVLLGGDDGYLRLLTLAEGRSVWSYRVGGPIESSPAVANGYVVVGCNDGYVYAFRAE